MRFKKSALIIIVIIICLGTIVFINRSDRILTNQNDSTSSTWEEMTAEAVMAMKAGRNDEASAICNDAMKIAGRGGPGDLRQVKTLMLMGEIHRWGKRFDLAEQSYKDAVISCEQAAGPNNPDMAMPLDALANFYYFTLKRYDLTAQIYQRILDIVSNQPGRDDRETARRAKNLADVYQLQKQYEKAEPFYKQALELSEKTNDDVPNYLLTLAEFYRLWGKCGIAESAAKRASEIREKSAQANSETDAQLDLALSYEALAGIYMSCGRADEAEIFYRQSIVLVESATSEENPDLSGRLTGLGEALRKQGKFEEAESNYKRALAITEENPGGDTPEAAEILEKYAILLSDMNRPDEAKLQLEQAQTIRKNTSIE